MKNGTNGWQGLRRRRLACGLWTLVASILPAVAHAGALSNLVVANLNPTFHTDVTQYAIPRTAACSVPVSATLSNPTHRLYIASAQTASDATRNVWVCDGVTKFSVVIYAGWTEVGRYTVSLVNGPTPTPVAATPTLTFTPTTPSSYLTSLVVPGLTPAFSPAGKQYTLVRGATCSVPVTATLTDPSHKLYIGGSPVTSGATYDAWICDGQTKIDVIVYQVWNEKARYTITLVDPPPTATFTPTSTPTHTATPTNSSTPTETSTPAPPPIEPQPTASPSPQTTSGLPPANPTDARTAERLLQQASFGPTAAEMAAVQSQGVDLWLAEQLAMAPGGIADGLDSNQVRAQLFLKMANGQDQLRQRMAFALSQILVVSTNKLVNGYELIPWVRLLENHAFGSYRDLLRAVTLSPSMGKFLDLANSVGTNGQAPNENYPREIMQLFSIGLYELEMDGSFKKNAQGQRIPTYDQALLKEVARALSGWTYPTAPGASPVSHNPDYFVGEMEPRPQNHDSGTKTIFGVTLEAGQSVEEDLDDVIDLLFFHPNTAPFIATRLIRSLVTSNPSAAYIERVAQVFANDGTGKRGNLRAVLLAILTDDEAALPNAGDGRLRDPVLHVLGLARALGVQVANPIQFLYVTANLGQQVLSPPSVFSFYSPLATLPGDPGIFGPEFQIYTPALAIQRANFLYSILSGGFSSSFPIDLSPFQAQAANPPALVELVNQRLLFGRMSTPLRDTLVDLAQHTSDLKQRVLGTLYLTALSSEFSVHTGPTVF